MYTRTNKLICSKATVMIQILYGPLVPYKLSELSSLYK